MREGFDHGGGLPQAMVYSGNNLNFAVRGRRKGAEAILRERGLWPHNSWRSDRFKFKLEFPKTMEAVIQNWMVLRVKSKSHGTPVK